MPPAQTADHVGAATLERMAAAPRFNRWMFERLRPWIGRRVLEIGAGIGNMSAFLVDQAHVDRVVLTDTEPVYLGHLRERFAGRPHVSVAELRLPAVSSGLLAERLDTVVCLNVLEHIEDDAASLRAMHDLLRPDGGKGGRLVLLVPALRLLYGTLDEALGHFRRAEAVPPRVSSGLAAERLDPVVCLNVLEHIGDDAASLRAMHDLLRPDGGKGGRLVLLVPALRLLYGTLDEALGHFRRYVPDELVAQLRTAGFRVRHLEYFNLAGVPGWWLTGRLLRRRLIPTGALRWYEALVPLFRLERLLPWRIGQSLIAIGEVGG